MAASVTVCVLTAGASIVMTSEVIALLLCGGKCRDGGAWVM
jgi:hypothetical protein